MAQRCLHTWSRPEGMGGGSYLVWYQPTDTVRCSKCGATWVPKGTKERGS